MSPQHHESQPGLWRLRDFRLLWMGHSISMLGSQITPLALPLLAALTLHATPAQMALLTALQYIPAIVLGLFAGVWVDRLRRRPVMIASDIARALCLLCVPIGALLGLLRIEIVYVITVLLSIGGLFFGIADAALLPALVRREQLIEAQSALTTSSTIAMIAGPGLAGVLIQWLTAPFAVLVDGISFLISALAASRLHVVEAAPAAAQPTPMGRAIIEGLGAVVRQPTICALLLASCTFDIGWNTLYAMYVLYLTRVLGLGPGMLGLIFGVGSIGALLGSLVAQRVSQRWGIGPVLITAQLLIGLGSLLIPAASVWPNAALPVLILAELIQSGVGTIYGMLRYGLTQAVIPDQLRGRVRASTTVIGLLPAIVGAALGGILGEWLGIVPTVQIGALLGLCGWLWLLAAPIRTLRSIPTEPEA